MSNNPLITAYKTPSLYVSLPSNGNFYTEKPKLSVDGELAIYPMTAKDEIISKTPDALFNGEATIALLESCCPDITNPRSTPVNDLLVLLLAIRQASYGDDLDVDIKCPECDHLNMLSVNINNLLSTVGHNTIEDTLTITTNNNEFIMKLKPYNIEDRTLLQLQQIKQEKMIQSLTDINLSDYERNQKFGETFVEITKLTIDLLSNCIVSVTIDDNEVTDRNTINEWLQTITKDDYDELRRHIEKMSESGINNKFNATCQNCNHEWKTDIELDMANFFAG